MPQTTINRRCGCKGSDEGVWVVHCGASVVKPGDCKVTTDCKGTCSPTGKFKPSKDMKPTIDNMMHEVAKNMLNEVQCPCYAERGPGYSGYEQLQCVDSYNNLVNVMGCCNDDQAGGADNPLHATCNGAGCGALMGSTGCWGGRATDRDGNLRGDQELTKQIQTVGGCTDDAECQSPSEPHGCCEGGVCTTCGEKKEPSIDNMMNEAVKNMLNEVLQPSIDNMMNEAATNVFCEQEGQDDGEVEVYRVTVRETGEIINVDRNHEMWSEISSAVQKSNPRKVKQLNELFGAIGRWLCCRFRGGCCGWEISPSWASGHYYGSIEWDACCGNHSRGGCCGGAMIVPGGTDPINQFIQPEG